MAGNGFPASGNARRQNKKPGSLVLPSSGRPGKPPKWPLPREAFPKAQRVPKRSSAKRAREIRAENAALAKRKKYEADYHAQLLKVWSDLWALPQAVAWEQQFMHRTVARYVQILRPAERFGDLKHAAEARQLEDRLGLSPMALLRLNWEIGEVAAAAAPEPKMSKDELAKKRRERFGAA